MQHNSMNSLCRFGFGVNYSRVGTVDPHDDAMGRKISGGGAV